MRRDRIKKSSSNNPRPRGKKWPRGFPVQPTRSGRRMGTKVRRGKSRSRT